MRFPMAVSMDRPVSSRRKPGIFDDRNGREIFEASLLAYAEATGTTRQAWMLEAVIRTSRGIANDSAVLDSRAREVLEEIKFRYRAFHPQEPVKPIRTFADAHAFLKELFF
jgi:hypothetical protein